MKEVKVLNELKGEFEAVTGIKWFPEINLNNMLADKPNPSTAKAVIAEKKKNPAKQVHFWVFFFCFKFFSN